jgi:hypothetical protein
MARRRLLFFLLVLVPACRNTNQQLLESELRTREFQVREMKDELTKHAHVNQALLYEIGALRQGIPISPEGAAQTYGLRRIALGRMTGGYRKEGMPVDEGLEVYVEPRDADDHIIKIGGTLSVQALEITSEGVKVPFAAWEIGPDRLRFAWKQGLLTTGYVMVLPWQAPPASENVRVIARLTLSDGRVFEADRDVRVRIVRPPHHALPPRDGPEIQLPPPRKLEPGVMPMKWRPAA